MSTNWPRTLLAMFTLCAVLLLVLADLEYSSPGPLSATHAQVAELQGREGCAACHGSSEDALRLACLECHEPIDQQLAATTGFHGQLDDRNECGRCHLEHVEGQSSLVTAAVFALAGVQDRDQYDHAGLGFDLHGAHSDLSCESCHVAADSELLAAGTPRFLGLTQDCAECHESPHGEDMGPNCAECHSQDTPFDLVENYEHDPIFPLVGAHEDIGCYDCHHSGTPYAVEEERAVAPAFARECSECHEEPHADSFLVLASETAQVEQDSSCNLCHPALVGGFTLQGSSMTAEEHAATGFALVEPHALACDACHDPQLKRTLRFPGRKADDCRACHEDPHAGQFLQPAEQERACLDCHAPNTFLPHQFDEVQHAALGFALDGAHLESSCSECHEPEPISGVVRFRPTSSNCADCHRDVHRGAFLATTDELFQLEERTDCANCHDTSSFANLVEDTFEHGKDAGFSLLGAHERTACATCHVPSESAAAEGRTLGFAADAFPGPAGRCDTCHADVHEGQFALDPVTGEQADCSACHTQEDFRSRSTNAFEHGTWTGFDLRGAHVQAECASCHQPTEQADEQGRSFGRVEALFPGDHARCDTCHDDVHQGLFRIDPVSGKSTDCSDCHDEQAFSPQLDVGFDHGGWTQFELEGVHETADCAACHPACPPDAKGRTFGRALGVGCADCHRDPHLGQFRISEQNDCARCHSSQQSFTSLRFDHDRDTTFSLGEPHASLDCSACHRPWTTASGLRAIRYTPLAHDCADCHLPDSGGHR